MCQLFGVSAAHPVEVNDFLLELFIHSQIHAHGWGMAVFYGSGVNIEKEPVPAWQSNYLKSRLSDPVEVRAMIAHIRRASVGKLAYENCHPFTAKDESGRSWTLAHNGTVFHTDLIDPFHKEQRGTTDSEGILRLLIHRMNQRLQVQDGPLSARERFALAQQAILDLAEGNKLNLLFYDGELLYVHTNQTDHLVYRRQGDAILFATVPLDGGTWESVPANQLLAYQDGQLYRRGTPHHYLFQETDAEPDLYESALL